MLWTRKKVEFGGKSSKDKIKDFWDFSNTATAALKLKESIIIYRGTSINDITHLGGGGICQKLLKGDITP